MLGVATVAAAAVGLHIVARSRRKRKIVITGGCGNLGSKLSAHLLELGGFDVVLVEKADFFRPEKVPAGATCVQGDLCDAAGAWREALRGAHAVVHFSAVNPYPNASFAESGASMLQTFNVFVAAATLGVSRVLFASSNHCFGQYKDHPELGQITPASPFMCGTPLHNREDLAKSGDAIAYGVAKMSGEQLAAALAPTFPDTRFVMLRIGWCQPGANRPDTLNPAGCPPEFQTKTAAGGGGGGGGGPAAASVDETWFKSMWLSNGDFLAYFTSALRADACPHAVCVVNAMSANRGMRWSLDETRAWLGVSSTDDSYP